jgi:hypothetical protein
MKLLIGYLGLFLYIFQLTIRGLLHKIAGVTYPILKFYRYRFETTKDEIDSDAKKDKSCESKVRAFN